MGGQAAADLWSSTIVLPRRSEVDYLDGRTDKNVPQGTIPSCEIGTISGFTASKAMEIFGNESIRNASPYGLMTMELPESGMFGTKRGDIDDIILVLHVNGVEA